MAKNIKERAAKRAEVADKRPRATASYVRMTPSKVKRILDIIRGKKYSEALAILEATPHSSSVVIKKILNSAAANAENNLSMNKDNLIVAECYANLGPILKRMMPRAKGRGDRILKKTTHITVILSSAIVKEGVKNDGTKN